MADWSGLENPETDCAPSVHAAERAREVRRARYADRLLESLWDRYVMAVHALRTAGYTRGMFYGCFAATCLIADASLPAGLFAALALGFNLLVLSPALCPKPPARRTVSALVWLGGASLVLGAVLVQDWAGVLPPSGAAVYGGDPLLEWAKRPVRSWLLLHPSTLQGIAQLCARYDSRVEAPDASSRLVGWLLLLLGSAVLLYTVCSHRLPPPSRTLARFAIGLLQLSACGWYLGTARMGSSLSANRFLDWGGFKLLWGSWGGCALLVCVQAHGELLASFAKNADFSYSHLGAHKRKQS